MFDAAWSNSGDVVADQVTPASYAIPQLSIVSGYAGVSTEYVRGDHQHPLQVSTVLPAKDTAVVTVFRKKDTGTGTAGSSYIYARSEHQHPPNIDPTSANVPLVNATAAANGTSDYYSTKFIKTGGLASEILCANGDTTTIDSKFSGTYNGSAGGWIRLCVFLAGASVGNPFIEFKLYSMYYAVQTVRLVPYYTVNGINTVHGIFTVPVKVSSYYDIEQGVNQLFHNHSGSGTSAIYSVYVRLESAGTVTIVVSDQSTYYTNRITEILTQDVIQGVANGTQIPITYDLANGGIINNMLQVNPTDRNYTTYNNGIRIGNYNTEYSSLYLGCSTTAINTRQTDQWEISKTSDKALTVNPSSLRQADHSVGLSSSTSFAGVKCGAIQINPTAISNGEGLRIARSTIGNFSGIFLGCDSNSTAGTIPYQWCIVNTLTGELWIDVDDQILQSNKGLLFSADGNTLTFNGRVL
ncbi:MAG: hypothetical protein EZS28_024709 [Streblomastix strix]|uniref:Uncharacterized protein n=1 Tax=Streblomastix strix TaxID=222440 RepID=A0A5J4VBB1_9EUKA|nr:MAG: hypothetical protein EZS28_024709 [Streblomastix strix]